MYVCMYVCMYIYIHIYCKRLPVAETLLVAASTLSVSSAYKTSVFSEINPAPPYYPSLKILPMERSSVSKN